MSHTCARSVFVLAVLLAARTAPAAAQSQTIYSEDFEGGLGGWDAPIFYAQGLWHLAEPGECLATSRMMACTQPAGCTYDTGGDHVDGIRSPPITFTGEPPYTVSFDYRLDCFTGFIGEDVGYLMIDQDFVPIIVLGGNDFVTDGTPSTASVSYGSTHAGATVYFTLLLSVELDPDAGNGFFVDNFRVTNGGGWKNLLFALPGTNGAPVLGGSGVLAPSSANQLALSNALPGANSVLVVGLSTLNAHFKGGVLVPAAQVLVPLPVSGSGTATLSFTLPANTPPALMLYFQSWVQDPGAVQGWASSNALRGTTS